MSLRPIIIAFLVITAVAVSFLGTFFANAGVDANEHQAYFSSINMLKAAISRLKQDVLLCRYESMLSYDNVNSDLQRLKRLKHQLGNVPAFLPQKERNSLLRLQERLHLEIVENHVIDFMRLNSLTRNSLQYLLHSTNDILNNKSVQQTTQSLAEGRLLQDALSSYLISDPSARITVLTRLANARNNQAYDPKLLAHAELVLNQKDSLGQAVDRLLSDDLERTALELESAYLEAYQRAIKPREAQRLLLFVTSILLIISVFAYIIEKLTSSAKAVRLAEARYRSIFENAPEGIFRLSADGSEISINPALISMIEAESETNIESQLRKVIATGKNKDLFDRLLYDLSKDKNVHAFETMVDMPDHPPVWVSISARMTETHGIKYFEGSIVDITARKEAERLFEDFYSMVSHELRSPLTSILAVFKVLDVDKTALPESHWRMVRAAQRSCDRLVRLVNDLLDFKQLESGKFELLLEEVTFMTVLKTAVSGLMALFSKEGITVSMPSEADDASVFVDQDRIVQVLVNLISNSIKYSPKGGAITIKIDSVTEPQFLRCSILDQGPGVPAESRDNLFSRFGQIRSKSGQIKKGTGLGLFISKSLIEEHGGTIGYEPLDEGGSCFWFTVPTTKNSSR